MTNRAKQGAGARLTITRDEYALGIDMFIADHIHLARYVVLRCPLVAGRAVVALAFNDDADSEWRQLASYALHELKVTEAERELTPMEGQVRSIAERIYDTSLTVGRRLGLDLFPADSDRAAARRKLDEAFDRAVFELTPMTEKEN